MLSKMRLGFAAKYVSLCVIIMLGALYAAGCGGGGGGSAPAASAGTSLGKVNASVRLSGMSGYSRVAAQATGTIDIDIIISGYYFDGDTEFEPVTAEVQLDLALGYAQVSVLDVPIGLNHLLTVIAYYPDGTSETLMALIPEVAESQTSQAEADERSTAIAKAAIAMAESSGVLLSEITQEDVDSIADTVDYYYSQGIDYDQMDLTALTDISGNEDVPGFITISPEYATVEIGQTEIFTASVMNIYGDVIATPTISWSVSGSIGTISGGTFIASTAGEGYVVATSGDAAASAPVYVPGTTAYCGDGTVDSGEDCDDGAESATCNSDCTYSVCGDGIYNVTAGEECDGAGESASCNTDCTMNICGDGITNATAGETCDDGVDNGMAGMCNSTCDGTTAASCGNSVIETGEDCDDGAETASCNSDCTYTTCGDGITNTTAGETCDDGVDNGTPAMCNSTCSGITSAVCGNSVVETGEDCDDGTETSSCNADCTTAACGDSYINSAAGETCDDGVSNGSAGMCNNTCDGTVCVGLGGDCSVASCCTGVCNSVGYTTTMTTPGSTMVPVVNTNFNPIMSTFYDSTGCFCTTSVTVGTSTTYTTTYTTSFFTDTMTTYVPPNWTCQ